MLRSSGGSAAYVPLSSLASRSAACLDAQHSDRTVAHYGFSGIRGGAQLVASVERTIQERKARRVAAVCVVPELDPEVPQIWNIANTPSEMALASTGSSMRGASRRRTSAL